MAAVGTATTFKTRVQNRLGPVDTSKLTPPTAVLDIMVDDVVDEYNKLRPLRKTFEQAGSDTAVRFQLDTVVTGWRIGSSQIDAIERVSDANTDDEAVDRYPEHEWWIDIDTSDKEILRIATPVGADATMRIRWFDRHLIHASDAALTTVPEIHTEVVTLLGVAFLCNWIARRASEFTDAALGADQVDMETIATRWRDRAVEAYEQAMERLAPGDPHQSSGTTQEWKPRSKLSQMTRISH